MKKSTPILLLIWSKLCCLIHVPPISYKEQCIQHMAASVNFTPRSQTMVLLCNFPLVKSPCLQLRAIYDNGLVLKMFQHKMSLICWSWIDRLGNIFKLHEQFLGIMAATMCVVLMQHEISDAFNPFRFTSMFPVNFLTILYQK